MSYDGNYIRLDPRFRQIATSESADYKTNFNLLRKTGKRLRQVGDFAIKSTKRFIDVSNFVSDKEFATYMTLLGIGVGAAGLVAGLYLGDKYGLVKIGTKSSKGIMDTLFPMLLNRRK